MHRENRRLRWAPRVRGLGMALFLSVFALDAFGEGGLLRNVAGFLIHLIPSFIVLAVLIAAWRRALVDARGLSRRCAGRRLVENARRCVGGVDETTDEHSCGAAPQHDSAKVVRAVEPLAAY